MIDRSAPRPDVGTVEREVEAHRRELTGHCHRILGSGFEAEDAVQETMVRAWRHFDRFEGRSTLRTWLYHIATNVCLDMRRGRQRRARPIDFGPSSTVDGTLGLGGSERRWAQLLPDGHGAAGGDPAEVAASREMIRAALVAAMRHLPPRQWAVVILRDVLGWRAREVAELLGTTVASVSSALQRARATLDSVDHDALDAPGVEGEQHELLACYVDAFERHDISSLVALVSLSQTPCCRGRSHAIHGGPCLTSARRELVR